MHIIYKTGQQFLDECSEILQPNLMQTSFFVIDAKLIDKCNDNDYIVKVFENDKSLLMLHYADFPSVLFGDKSLCLEMATVISANKFAFNALICEPDLAEAFLFDYEKINGGSHVVKYDMKIMYCTENLNFDTRDCRWATQEDLPQIANMVVEFTREALGEDCDFDETINALKAKISGLAVLEIDGKIVSFAAKASVCDKLARITHVYTAPKFRNNGYSRKVVTFLTQSILEQGQIATLNVDTHNAISNHLYSSMGYKYLVAQCHFIYQKQ